VAITVIDAPGAARLDAPAASTSPSGPRPPLKIGIVSPYGFPHPGGVNEHVRHAYDELRSLGHDAWIITPKYGRERDSEGHVIGPAGRCPATAAWVA
jgi:hypothetical protein